MDSLQNPTISLTVYQTDQEVPAVKWRAAAQAYCQMLIDLYRLHQNEKTEPNGPIVGVL